MRLRNQLSASVFFLATLAFAVRVGAVENGAVRIAPGWGGGELAVPLLPGLVGTVGFNHYEASKVRDNEGNTPIVPIGSGLNAQLGARVRVDVMVPRLAYISNEKVFGANVGVIALVPYLRKRQSFTLEGLFPPGFPAATAAGVQNQLNEQAASLGGSRGAWGDFEFAPVLSWYTDRVNFVFAASVIVPTGQYDAASPVNAGSGKYATFRPTLSAGYAGDGWDAGARAVVAFNQRNKDTQVKSGSYYEIDFSLLKQVQEVRLGVMGYVLQQVTKDNGPNVAPDGNKLRVAALGPGLSYANGDSSWLVDVKFLQEFGARNRTEGRSAWLSVSRRF